MLGYEQNGHSYWLLDVASNKMLVVTHVVFDEFATSHPLLEYWELVPAPPGCKIVGS